MTVALIASVLLNAFLLYRFDRYRATRSRQRTYLEACMEKALRDGTHLTRIPSEDLRAAFNLTGRTHTRRRFFHGKGGPHPATLRPARRVGL